MGQAAAGQAATIQQAEARQDIANQQLRAQAAANFTQALSGLAAASAGMVGGGAGAGAETTAPVGGVPATFETPQILHPGGPSFGQDSYGLTTDIEANNFWGL